MGRPLKSDDKRRTAVLRVRLTESEKSRIETKASDAGLTPSDYVRGQSLGAKPERHVPTQDRAALLKALAELNKVGSNYNQIARALNRRQDSDDLTGVDVTALNHAHYGIAVLTKHMMELLSKWYFPAKIRGNGKELADYVLAQRDNERVWILEVDGRENADPEYLRQTIMSMEHMAELTKAKQAYFHAEITPAYGEEAKMTGKDYQRCAGIIAEHLGYTNSRRVIVMHHKKGKSHAHVIFERYNYQTGKMVDNKHSRLKLVQARIQMEKEFGHKPMPLRNRNQKALKEVATKLWNDTAKGAEFVKAARKAGYMVAEGTANRPFMIVDKTGRSFNLVRQLEGVRTKEVRARLRGEKLTPEKQAIEIMRKEGSGSNSGKQEQQKAQFEPDSKQTASKAASAFAENRTDSLQQEAKHYNAEQSRKNQASFATFKAEASEVTKKPQTTPDNPMQRKEVAAKGFAENKQSGLETEAERAEKKRQLIAQQQAIRQRVRKHRRSR